MEIALLTYDALTFIGSICACTYALIGRNSCSAGITELCHLNGVTGIVSVKSVSGVRAMLSGAIEPVPIEDTFINDIHWVEPLPNNMVRFWLYAIEGGEKVIKAKIVCSKSAFVQMHDDNKDRLQIANDT